MAFAPDGRTLVTGSQDQTAILWDLTDRAHPRRLGQPLTGHTDVVNSVAMAPDGNTLATGSYDRTVQLWDLANRAHPRRLGQPLTGANPAFAPDGRTLATSSTTVVLWDLTELNDLRRHAVERACSLTRQGFDREEWARYVPGLPYQNTCP